MTGRSRHAELGPVSTGDAGAWRFVRIKIRRIKWIYRIGTMLEHRCGIAAFHGCLVPVGPVIGLCRFGVWAWVRRKSRRWLRLAFYG